MVNFNDPNQMNWCEAHPLYSIIILSLTIAAFTWGVLRFVIDENKENTLKVQIEKIKTEQAILTKR